MRMAAPRGVTVIIPCYNEADVIAQVVRDFRKALPDARIVICDNNSDDDTGVVAQAAGAEVYQEHLQGKGSVVRRMFADFEADVYMLVDGDGTYDASSALTMVEMLIEQRLDMVVARRLGTAKAYRPGHRFGNRLLSGAICRIFGNSIRDILSGYRVFSRRFIKSFPGQTEEFEIETELTIHALKLGLPVGEIDTPYYPRPENSPSKLRTWRDGLLILLTIVRLFALERPFGFFLGLASRSSRRPPFSSCRRSASTCRPGWCPNCLP